MLRLLWCVGLMGIAAATACVATPEKTELRTSVEEAVDAGVDAGPLVSADQIEIVRGVPNRNRDPAVVAIRTADGGLCSGTLISPRLVLTARHCTSRTVTAVTCPPSGVQVLGDRDPASLEVLFGDDVASAHSVAHGVSVVAPSGVTLCDADIAVLVLDRAVKLAKPLPVRTRGVARGDRVRAVGFGRTEHDEVGIKLVREHVRVLSVTPAELTVGEATCQGDSGGPALDETTGEIVGVVSRGGPSCEGPGVHNIYTRADTFTWLVEEAFATVAGLEREGAIDGGTSAGTPPPRGTKQKPQSDMGAACETAADCAAGVCITADDRKYCSRPCGPGDRCPAHYHCRPIASGSTGAPPRSACIAVR